MLLSAPLLIVCEWASRMDMLFVLRAAVSSTLLSVGVILLLGCFQLFPVVNNLLSALESRCCFQNVWLLKEPKNHRYSDMETIFFIVLTVNLFLFLKMLFLLSSSGAMWHLRLCYWKPTTKLLDLVLVWVARSICSLTFWHMWIDHLGTEPS